MGFTGTAVSARSTSTLEWRTLAVPAAAVLATLSVVATVVGHPPPVWDQEQLLRSSWTGPRYPSPQWGPTSQALVATLRLAVPAAALDFAVKVTAAGVLFVVVAALGLRVLRHRTSVVGVLVLVATSPVPRLWLSSEVVLAAAVVGVLLAATSRRPWLVGVTCALVCLSKPDGLAVGIALAAWFGWRWRDWRVMAGLAGTSLVLLPGTLLVDNYWRWKAHGDRSWVAFGQHFASTVGLERLPIGVDPWTRWETYTSRLLPGASSVGDVVRHHTGMYVEFLRVGLQQAVKNGVSLLGPLVAVAGFAGWAWRRLSDVGRGAMVATVGFVPNVVLAFPSVRHFARWYPLAALGAFWLWEHAPSRTWRAAVGLVIVASVVWNVATTVPYIS